jgi:hypothetical protein
MKSAYELALERLEKSSGPTQKLSDEQKARIAEIDKTYEAKIAETKLASEARVRAATTVEERDQALAELADALASIESRREKEKEAVWNRHEA